MKVKKYILGIGVIVTLVLGSFCMSRVTNISAHKRMRPLAGVQIVLDAGHGGKDDGALSGDIKEDVINLQIVKKLQKRLEHAGANVILTREDDYDLASNTATNRKKEDMKRRMEKINEEDVDLFLSVHLNSYPNPKVKGAQTFYQRNNEVSKTFATIVQNHLKTLTKTKMTSKQGDYYLLNNAEKIGALVECGFLSNVEDREKLVDDDYQNKLAKTLYESICEYFEFLQ